MRAQGREKRAVRGLRARVRREDWMDWRSVLRPDAFSMMDLLVFCVSGMDVLRVVVVVLQQVSAVRCAGVTPHDSSITKLSRTKPMG